MLCILKKQSSLTCLVAPECGPWQHIEARPPWKSAPSGHRLTALWSGHSLELHKKERTMYPG